MRSGTVEKKVGRWWSTNANGSVVFFVRFGWATIEFEKGNAGISVPSMEKLPGVVDTLIEAVRVGEPDSQLASIAADAKKKIAKKPTKKAA